MTNERITTKNKKKCKKCNLEEKIKTVRFVKPSEYLIFRFG